MTKLPPAPTYFHKPITALNAHGADVVRPEGCRWLNYEGEIAIVIGRTCRNVAPADAGEYIAGYTVANDYGLHDFRDTDAGSMLRVKGSDTLCPVGPALVDGVGLPRQGHPHAASTARCARTAHRRDGVGHALPRRRHRPHDHARARRPAALRDAGQLPARRARRRRDRRGRGAGRADQPHRRPGRRRSATTSALSRRESEEVRSTALGGDWEHRGVRAPQGPGAQHYQSALDDD